jgi:hypothetical protein
VKVVDDPSGISQTRILLRKDDELGAAADSEAADWVDLESFLDSFAEISRKPSSSLSESELLVVYYSEILDILRDLCCKRCTEAMRLVSASKKICLTFDHLIKTVQSVRVPSEIRGRLAQLIAVLYVDCEPQRAQALIPEVRLVSLDKEVVGTTKPQSRDLPHQPESLKILKHAVISYIEGFSNARVESGGKRETEALLKQFCELAISLLNFGLFMPDEGTVSNDLNRLVKAVMKNISSLVQRRGSAEKASAEIQAEEPSTQGSTDQVQELIQTPETEREIEGSEGAMEVDDSDSGVLELLGKILELAFDMRTGSRLEFLISKYEQHRPLTGSINVGSTEFTNVLNEMKGFLESTDLCKCESNLVTERIFSLSTVQGNSLLQALALKLLIRQLAPIKEVMEISSTLFLVDDPKAVSCHQQLRESVGKIRSSFEDSGYGVLQADTISILSENLSIISALLSPQRSGMYLVKEVQKLLKMDKVHLVLRDILKIPLGVKHTANGLDEAESTSMLQLFIQCYDVLQAFCFENTMNQEAIFTLLPDFLDHVSIEGLNASECFIACLSKNAVLCSKIPEKLLRHFLMVIIKYGKKSRWLRVLLVAMSGSDQPVANTQNVVLRNLMEMAELILELDGHQGYGHKLETDPNTPTAESTGKSGTSTQRQNASGGIGASSAVSEQVKSDTTKDSPRELKRRGTFKLLEREGNATRQELMLQQEHATSLQDSFLEYHVLCLETLAKCAEGHSQLRKDECQSLLSFDEALESILDLHLSPSAEAPKVSQDVLRYIRTGSCESRVHPWRAHFKLKTY